jgi:hypothetical protein
LAPGGVKRDLQDFRSNTTLIGDRFFDLGDYTA